MTKEEKIAAVSQLMTDGILTAEEFALIVPILSGHSTAAAAPEKTPTEHTYEDYMRNHVAYAFKSPSSIQFPPLNPSMIQEGMLNVQEGLRFKPMPLRFILSYIDASNSYGAMLRHEIAIVIDDGFVPQFTLQRVKGLMGGQTNNWMRMPGVR